MCKFVARASHHKLQAQFREYEKKTVAQIEKNVA